MFNIFPLKNGLDNVAGFCSCGIHAGLKSKGQNDLAFIRSDTLCDVSAVFTQNRFRAAPIMHYLAYPQGFKTNFILINSKNANAMTGEQGVSDIDAIFAVLKQKLPTIKNPIMSSTGVIGYPLNKEKITQAFDKFDFAQRDSDASAQAIMTTDTFKKELCLRVELEDGSAFHIAAIAKGAGMINPAMATMLCFVLTDANIPKSDMDELLAESAEQSFNAISVDGDTSTNDTLMLLSSAASGVYEKNAFKQALDQITKFLSLEMLRDGEGSNKVVAFEVNSAASVAEATKAARALSNSLLVKTALFGEDPNWGRIASTIGASRVTCDATDLEIYYDDVVVYSKEFPYLDERREELAHKVMQKKSFKITINLNAGAYSYTAYGCDLSYEYVKINADYRT